jgi:uncharacterized membrane protein YjjB (DUF3815 family)
MKNANPRGWVYLGLFALGAVLVATGVVKADNLLEWLLTVALAASAAGNVLARAFLSPKTQEPPGIDPLGPNA